MADVADLFFLHLEDDEEVQEIDFGSETLDPDPYPDPDPFSFSSSFEDDNKILIQLVLSPPLHRSFDLFYRCPHPETLDTSDFRFLDEIETGATRYQGSEIGLGFDFQEEHQEEEEQYGVGDGLRILGFETDTELDPGLDPIDGDTGLSLCWDSFCLEEERRDADDDFEWEEVDALWAERDIHGMMAEEEESRNVDWEFLLSVNNVEEDGDFMNPYEILFGQFAVDDSTIRGRPPAARSVVDTLPSIVLTKEDSEKKNAVCAVCKEEISSEEKVKQLPCLHQYHGDCILPWLGMRNTCPVCRFELPTDDAEYEGRKAQRRANDDRRSPGVL